MLGAAELAHGQCVHTVKGKQDRVCGDVNNGRERVRDGEEGYREHGAVGEDRSMAAVCGAVLAELC